MKTCPTSVSPGPPLRAHVVHGGGAPRARQLHSFLNTPPSVAGLGEFFANKDSRRGRVHPTSTHRMTPRAPARLSWWSWRWRLVILLRVVAVEVLSGAGAGPEPSRLSTPCGRCCRHSHPSPLRFLFARSITWQSVDARGLMPCRTERERKRERERVRSGRDYNYVIMVPLHSAVPYLSKHHLCMTQSLRSI